MAQPTLIVFYRGAGRTDPDKAATAVMHGVDRDPVRFLTSGLTRVEFVDNVPDKLMGRSFSPAQAIQAARQAAGKRPASASGTSPLNQLFFDPDCTLHLEGPPRPEYSTSSSTRWTEGAGALARSPV
jgi:hypothetical protein